MKVTEQQLPQIATALVAYLKAHKPQEGASCLLLRGDLGAGKTTLVQHIARALGVEHLVPSPTFVIMRKYETSDREFSCLVHIDAYRLEKSEEVGPLKLPHVFSGDNTLVCIEWPERLGDSLPAGSISIELKVAGERERTLMLDEKLAGYLESGVTL